MRPNPPATVMFRLFLLRLSALLALAVSAALAVNSLLPSAEFCGYHSDCDRVLLSGYGRVAGIPLPYLGLLAFGAVLVASLFPAQAARLLRPLGVAVGLGGLALIVVQAFVLHAVCPYCLVVDSSAVAVGVLGGTWGSAAGVSAPSPLTRGLWAAAALAAGGAGAGWALSRLPAETPPEITSVWVDDKVNVVEVADFECRICRKMHGVLTQFLKEHGSRVHFVQLAAPMPGHRHARQASRAYLCAQAQGKGAAMSEKLFTAEDLSADGCARIAEELGLAMAAFERCTADPAVDERLDRDLAWVEAVSPNGLPVVWVQDEMLFGLQTPASLQAALDRAEQRMKAAREKAAKGR